MDTEPTYQRDDADALDRIKLPAPGTVRRGTLRFSHPMLADWAWTYTVVRGAVDGPRLVLMSGVHPAEYPAIEANIRFTRRLDPGRLRGSLVSLPIVDVPAFLSRTPFVCPLDNKNPNRGFPGDPDGTFSDVMDDAIFRAVIAPADYLIDLHGGDLVEALMPFAIYSVTGNEAVDTVSAAMARVFGLPYVVPIRPQPGALGGTSVQAAAAVGIPAITPEAGGNGLLTEPETGMMLDGVSNVLRHLGMLDGAVSETVAPIEIDRFTWLTSPHEGMWYPMVGVGETVRAGQVVGRVANLFGDTLAEITAPSGGDVLFLTSSPAMREGGILLGLGERPGS